MARSASAAPPDLRETSPVSKGERILLVVLFALASLLYARFSLLRHDTLNSTGYDLAIFDQALWHLSRFETPESTVRRLPTIWADHFHPLLVLFAPAYWFGDGTRNLLVAQAFVVCSAAFPVWAFCRPRLGGRAALVVVAGFLLFWGVARGLAFDFHEFALTAPLAAWLLLAFDRAHRKEAAWWPVAVLAVLVLLTKEDQGFLVAAFGIVALFRREWRVGVPLALVGIGWPFFVMRVLHPLFTETEYFYWVYGHIAATPGGVLLFALRSPGTFLGLLFGPIVNKALLARLLFPFGWFALLSPYALLLVPNLLLRLLSATPQHAQEANHYTLPIAALLTMAAADGAARLLRRFPKLSAPRLASALAGVLLIWTAVEMRRVGLLVPLKPSSLTAGREYAPVRSALAAIPPEASVAATSSLMPHLSKRREAYQLLWSVDVPPVDYVLTRKKDPYVRDTEAWIALRGDYDLETELKGVRIYRRRTPPDPAYARFKARSFDGFGPYSTIALTGVNPHTPLSPSLLDPDAPAPKPILRSGPER